MQALAGGSKAPSGWWDAVVVACGDLLPAYPVLEALTIPPPPLLDVELPDKDIVDQLVRAYMCAYRESYGEQPSYTKARVADPRRLVKYAHAMSLAHVRPIAWAISRIDFYEKYARAGGRGGPALGWVYSAKALEERMDWYSVHEATHIGGRTTLVSEHRELLKRYNDMRRALYAVVATTGSLPTREQVAAIVAEHLPDDAYRDLAQKVHAKVRKLRRQLEKRMERGEYVW